MGYLERAAGVGDMSTGTLSLWFRVPAASLSAAREEWATALESPDPPPPMCGIVPLVVFGERGIPRLDPTTTLEEVGAYTANEWTWFGTPTCAYTQTDTAEVPIEVSYVTGTEDSGFDIDPSFIGIDCRTSRNVFVFAFQYPDGTYATVTGGVLQVVDVIRGDYDRYGSITAAEGCSPPSPLGPFGQPPPSVGGLYTIENVLGDVSDFWFMSRPEMFGTIGSGGEIGSEPEYEGDDDYHGAGPTVTADEWHHIILSWDWTLAVESVGKLDESDPSYDSTATVYLSFDDVNKTSRDIGFFMTGANSIVTPKAWTIYRTENDSTSLDTSIPDDGNGHSVETTYTNWVLPEYAFTPPAFMSDVVQIPGGPDWTKNVMVAELQLFNGVVIDTSDEESRRAFIKDNGHPAHPSLAIALMGQDPDVYFNNHSDWSGGENVGTAGDFEETGTILPFLDAP